MTPKELCARLFVAVRDVFRSGSLKAVPEVLDQWVAEEQLPEEEFVPVEDLKEGPDDFISVGRHISGHLWNQLPLSRVAVREEQQE